MPTPDQTIISLREVVNNVQRLNDSQRSLLETLKELTRILAQDILNVIESTNMSDAKFGSDPKYAQQIVDARKRAGEVLGK